MPADLAATSLAGGAEDNIASLTQAQYTAALTALEKIDDVNILCIPDRTDVTIQKAMIDHCERMADRFAVLDPPAGFTPDQIKAQRANLTSTNGYVALYYPQLYVANPTGNGMVKVPPSGHVAGVYARTDDQKGVHKAPANEIVQGVLDVERTIADNDHGPLNENSVNVIRSFPGRGIRVWGARTTSDGTQWRYVNVRRLLLYIEESIQQGTQFAVFEPNNSVLRKQVSRTVSEFLDRVWRSGALVGDKAEEAYRVRVDDELNPPATVALGQLVIEVRVAPTTPAEFVIFQIIQDPGRKIITE
jgi:phage tail sheath protein FI